MINRRHIRIKVLQGLYAYLTGNADVDPIQAKKVLLKNIDQIYDLYLYYFLVYEELVERANRRIEDNKAKRMPTEADLNPNMKFVNNRVFAQIIESSQLRKLSEERKAGWNNDEQKEMLRKLYYVILDSDVYQSYMLNSEDSFENDRSFALELFKEIIANHEPILHFFEEKSVDWLDDIDLVCKGVMKSLANIKEDGEFQPDGLHKNKKEDIDFAGDLLKASIAAYEDNVEFIGTLTSNWETDRIAKMDLILMSLAITELQEFSSIPKKVSLNEYIEISKFYSTPKSNGFINGILDKAVAKLESEGKIKKMGRGLVN